MSKFNPEPCAVVMTMRDGTSNEQVFASRFQAELFLYLLPLMMTTQPDGDQIASAILSPLSPARLADPAPMHAAQRFDHLHH